MSVRYVDTNKLLVINCPKQMIGEIIIFVCLAWAVGTRIRIHIDKLLTEYRTQLLSQDLAIDR